MFTLEENKANALANTERYPQYARDTLVAYPIRFRQVTGRPGERWFDKGEETIGYLQKEPSGEYRLHAWSSIRNGWCIVSNPKKAVQIGENSMDKIVDISTMEKLKDTLASMVSGESFSFPRTNYWLEDIREMVRRVSHDGFTISVDPKDHNRLRVWKK